MVKFKWIKHITGDSCKLLDGLLYVLLYGLLYGLLSPICSMVLEYLPTFSQKYQTYVGKYTINGAYGYALVYGLLWSMYTELGTNM